MAGPMGKKRWAIAEGWIPSGSTGPAPAMLSHETVCMLNTSDRDANVVLTAYFKDRAPVGPFRVLVKAKRTLHLRTNDLEQPEEIPRDTDYAITVESDVPIVVQHTRLDSRQAANTIMTTIAYAED